MSDEHHRQAPTAGPSSTTTFQPPQPPSQMPVLPGDHIQQGQQASPNPLLTQTFLAWLQYMHLQNQLSQTNPQPQPQIPFSYPNMSVPPVGQSYPSTMPTLQLDTAVAQAGPSQPRQRRQSTVQQAPESPAASEAGDGETDQAVSEDKRRRNTAASARFRVKKKQWTLNLERSITDLSGRVEELEREAAELRRENGWLKEIVMLKSKRFGAGGASSGEDSRRDEPMDKDDHSEGSGSNHSHGQPESAPDTSKGKGKGREGS
ncbi:hypothetical protein BXZ70DRAFT_550496 [Cristinia sonorae]|uniref:BZIP domain-containing protein n=1 Tax=Cristinia sonorae TaxID=1940300 RepID=A0A8K0UGM7_9AGAR|nr:hypothetical protein BXZ70DRAFT_550496 [Cristinia sonorae]